VFWVISVYFNIRNTLPNFGTFLPGHPVYSPLILLDQLQLHFDLRTEPEPYIDYWSKQNYSYKNNKLLVPRKHVSSSYVTTAQPRISVGQRHSLETQLRSCIRSTIRKVRVPSSQRGERIVTSSFTLRTADR
jgi:hypothetical protein